ncbi:MAG: gamma-glutamyl-gamma-aminobutyrate hydrolase family protein [Gemmatimonadetes bacterium]|nr:gamma-glutamyl-gamma-aminobutyrate hydrolase family protein [Gemmatimonadota bacterium]
MPEARPRSQTAARLCIGVTRWEDVPGEPIEQYWDRVREAGGEPIDLAGPPADVGALDGLMLTGGLDVAPARYGEAPHPKVKRADAARDDFEVALLNDALARDLPVLAICRGHQVLNVALGGGLRQHIDGDGHRADYRTEGYPSRWHTVRLTPESRLRALLDADEIEVNSRHHQAVLASTLAPGLSPVAVSPDGVIEAVESRAHRWVVGVQWHPERLEAEHAGFAGHAHPLFAALVRRARDRLKQGR